MFRGFLNLIVIFLLSACSDSQPEKVITEDSSAKTVQAQNKITEVVVAPEIKKPEITIRNKTSEKKDSFEKIIFNKTTDASRLNIPEEWFDTPVAKDFLYTGKNNYIGNPEMIALGKKRYNMWSCTQCHGPTARGQVGPGLTGPDFRYAKNTSNKGMFETIWAGTNGGMGAKGFGLMSPDDGIKPDELLKIIAFIRSNGDLNGND